MKQNKETAYTPLFRLIASEYGPYTAFSIPDLASFQPMVAENTGFEPDIYHNTEMAQPKVGKNLVSPTYQYRDADKRRAYMRDYMRRRRDEEKGHRRAVSQGRDKAPETEAEAL